MKVLGKYINCRNSEKNMVLLIINITDLFFSRDCLSEISINDL